MKLVTVYVYVGAIQDLGGGGDMNRSSVVWFGLRTKWTAVPVSTWFWFDAFVHHHGGVGTNNLN